jgi:serine/threonine protein kinase
MRRTDTCVALELAAPEVLKGQYNEKADLWSIGVIAFMLLSSSMPFFGKTRYVLIKRCSS